MDLDIKVIKIESHGIDVIKIELYGIDVIKIVLFLKIFFI